MPFCLPIVEAIWYHSNITLTPGRKAPFIPAESHALGANVITAQSQKTKAFLQDTRVQISLQGELGAMGKMHLFMSVV